MTPTFDERTDALVHAARSQPGVVGLVLLGSAAEAHRRDEWSDHDFFVVARPGAADEVRDVRAWLPDVDDVAALAREGEIGFSVLYRDGHVLEFAAATAAELDGAALVHHRVVFDDGSVAALVAASQDRAARAVALDPANETALFLVKVLLGVGRARRGEVLSGGQLVRQWATQHLVRAVRERLPSPTDPERIDPARRFEAAYPEIGARLGAALARPVEEAARDLHQLCREVLEPGWDDFPSAGADAVAHRLGWDG
ncbi:hypothetical protein Cch01nite_04680 [Cellulomonas chitinilytica]|uniref:Nucleotidyltransferase domain-containing protein n=1 Tax=Cellulomonas chitinilytica TaxID=398759 RepID=A0A919P1H4_9CELL|nr:hypothetical protein [Cellulomonas chitinilytica]GIG19744.1 hypothetical protein Cch01nite_04680 [Cellulomonas chitinilytica]